MNMSVPVVCDFPMNQEIVSCLHQLRQVRLAQYRNQLADLDNTVAFVAQQMGLSDVPTGLKTDVEATIRHWQSTLEAYTTTIHIDEIEFLMELVSGDEDFAWPGNS